MLLEGLCMLLLYWVPILQHQLVGMSDGWPCRDIQTLLVKGS